MSEHPPTIQGLKGAVSDVVGRFLTRGVDPERAQKISRKHHSSALEATTDPEWAKRLAASELIERYARRAALRSFLTSIPGGGLTIPLAFVEAQGAFSARLELALAIQLLVDDSITQQAGWRTRVLADTFELSDVALQGSRDAIFRAAREVAMSRGLRFVTKRIGRRLVPVLGGGLGAAMTYGWMHREGRRLAELSMLAS